MENVFFIHHKRAKESSTGVNKHFLFFIFFDKERTACKKEREWWKAIWILSVFCSFCGVVLLVVERKAESLERKAVSLERTEVNVEVSLERTEVNEAACLERTEVNKAACLERTEVNVVEWVPKNYESLENPDCTLQQTEWTPL